MYRFTSPVVYFPFSISLYMYFAFAYSCLLLFYVEELLNYFVKFLFALLKYTLIYCSKFEYLMTTYNITKPPFPVLRSYTKKSCPKQLKLVHGNFQMEMQQVD